VTKVNYEDDSIIASVHAKKELMAMVIDYHGEDVREVEKQYLSSFYKIPEENVFFLQQTHGIQAVKVATQDTIHNKKILFTEGDALYTEDAGLLLCIRTADCLPVFFKAECMEGNRSKFVVGIIHAGWRGLYNGIIEHTLTKITQTSNVNRIDLFMGPCIGAKAYEVGEEVADLFPLKEKISENKYLLDLRTNAELKIQNISNLQVHLNKNIFNGCTFNENNLYFSHRKQDTARNLNIILLKGA